MVFDHTWLDPPRPVWFPKFELKKTGLNVFYCVRTDVQLYSEEDDLNGIFEYYGYNHMMVFI